MARSEQNKPNRSGKPGALGFSFETVISVMNSIGTAWVFVLLVIINLDIGGRALFNHPLRGVPEIVALSIVGWRLSATGPHPPGRPVDPVRGVAPIRPQTLPPVGLRLDGIYHLIGAALCLILLKASYPLFTKAWTQDLYVGAQGDFMAPTWPVKLVILIGCAAAAIQFGLLAWSFFKKALGFDKSIEPAGEGGQ